MVKRVAVGRIAIRHEGNFLVAYLAPCDTMNDAIVIGSIAYARVQKNKELKEKFIKLMQEVMTDIVENELNLPIEGWERVKAPEHEKAGHS